ncbi:MAG: hypothetical protein ACTSX6_00295 [Candidatus Heimdallarchaeaceae archaeon]
MEFENFERPHRYKLIPAGSSDTVFYMEIPQGTVGFIEKIANILYKNTYYIFKVDNHEEKVERQIGTMDNPATINPPILAKYKIEVIGYNNSLEDYIFECIIDGRLVQIG